MEKCFLVRASTLLNLGPPFSHITHLSELFTAVSGLAASETLILQWFLKDESLWITIAPYSQCWFLAWSLCSSTENMVKGLDEDETSFLDEVSRKQCLIEKHRREEDAQEIKEYRISFCTLKHVQHYCHVAAWENWWRALLWRLSLSPLSPSLSWW